MPPRLYALLASEAPAAVVFRRGPSKMVRLVIWNRKTDKFKPVSRFKGRIFGEQSDLSPDGRRLLYFAMDGVAWATGPTGGTWTAISRSPSLQPEALGAQGGETRGGGGFFTSNHCAARSTGRRAPGASWFFECSGAEGHALMAPVGGSDLNARLGVGRMGPASARVAEGGCLCEARLGTETIHVGRTLCDFTPSRDWQRLPGRARGSPARA